VPLWLALVSTLTLSAAAQMVSLHHNSNLRKSASTSGAIVELLSSGTQVTLLSNKAQSGYYHVQAADGAMGWVWAKNVNIAVQPTSSSLLNQLHAARVAAVPQPLVIGGNEVCPAAGNSTNPKMIKLDSQKNRTDIPEATAYIPVDWDVLKGLPSNSPDDLQGAPVTVVGYLSHRINVEDKAPGESTNCNLLNDDEVDWHIYLTSSPNQGISQAIIVETTPRTRPLHKWDKSVLDGLVNTNEQVRISGWLMYDFQHISEIGTQRATVWEVHPVTRIEMSDGSGGWKDIEQNH
ncbi:MAG: SH3 domain-containing protein, partial [Terriglobales bacterium]